MMLLERLQLYGFTVKSKMSNLKKLLSSNSKKVCKIYIYNVLAHPVNKNHNNLKVATTLKNIRICKMVNVSHDPLSIESSQKTTPTIQNTL